MACHKLSDLLDWGAPATSGIDPGNPSSNLSQRQHSYRGTSIEESSSRAVQPWLGYSHDTSFGSTRKAPCLGVEKCLSQNQIRFILPYDSKWRNQKQAYFWGGLYILMLEGMARIPQIGQNRSMHNHASARKGKLGNISVPGQPFSPFSPFSRIPRFAVPTWWEEEFSSDIRFTQPQISNVQGTFRIRGLGLWLNSYKSHP
jgi:hypothetical protein